jgi:hypothetical protein
MSSCPPFFELDTARARSIAPAQVPQTDFVLTNSRSGSINPDRRASSAMVVDSGERVCVCMCRRVGQHTQRFCGGRRRTQTSAVPPPGMINASHRFSSSGVRTSIVSRRLFPFPESFLSIAWCSANAPCNAAIPIRFLTSKDVFLGGRGKSWIGDAPRMPITTRSGAS